MGDSLNAGDDFDLRGDISWTVEMWINRASDGGGGSFVSTINGANGWAFYDYNGHSGRNQGILVGNGTSTYYFTTGVDSIPDDTWTHIAIQHDAAGGCLLYTSDAADE